MNLENEPSQYPEDDHSSDPTVLEANITAEQNETPEELDTIRKNKLARRLGDAAFFTTMSGAMAIYATQPDWMPGNTANAVLGLSIVPAIAAHNIVKRVVSSKQSKRDENTQTA